MKFKKYHSIENHYRENYIQKILEYLSDLNSKNNEYVVLEKIHGTNFSFYVDRFGNIRIAKRNSFIDNPKSFYKSDEILNRYEKSVKKLFNLVKDKLNRDDIEYIVIYGEQFGGIYGNNKTYIIQKEIQYIPEVDFMIFDILAVYDNENKEEEFLNWDLVKDLANEVDMKHTPELFRSEDIYECLNYDVENIKTKVSRLYGLEPIDYIEGVVIKPVDDIRFKNHNERVIIKKKTKRFNEKGEPKVRNKNKKDLKEKLPKEVYEILEELTSYIEKPRIGNVIVKYQIPVDWKQFNKIIGLLIKDILEEYNRISDKFTKLDKDYQKIIKKELHNIAKDYVREFIAKNR